MGAESHLPGFFKVKLHEPTLVKPAEATDHHAYFLTNLDQNLAVIMQTVYVFEASPHDDMKKGEDPAEVMREALGKVLVHYYPLAGRLGISPEGKLNVNCNGEGVLFVEAEADARVSDLGDLSKPADPGRLGQLVYQVPPASSILDIPPIVVQVTKFECGGFVLGFTCNHAMFDGIAAMEFVNSWAETARGSPLSTPPALDRTFLKARSPPQIKYPHIEFLDIEDLSLLSQDLSLADANLVYKSFCFNPDSLERLKQKALQDGVLPTCTTFEALSGLVWRARSKAMAMKPDQKTKLLFAVDVRARLEPPLPRGYMGNGMVLACALMSAGELAESPFSNAVRHVQEAIALVTDDHVRSTIDFFEATRLRPALAATLVITAWSRLAFYTTDFGWGQPTHAGPVALPEREVALFLSHGKGKKSINVLLGLPSQAMKKLEEILQPELI